MVRRLVEEHDIRLGEEDDGEHDPHLPAAGEITAVLLEIAVPKSESGEDLPGLCRKGVTVLRVESGHGVLILLQELLVVRIVRFGMGERLLAALHRLFQVREAALSAEIVHQRYRFELDEVLGEVADRHFFAVRYLDRSRIEIDVAENRPQEGRLPRSVVADEADPTPIRDRPVDPLEDLPVGEREADVFQIDQIPQLPIWNLLSRRLISGVGRLRKPARVYVKLPAYRAGLAGCAPGQPLLRSGVDHRHRLSISLTNHIDLDNVIQNRAMEVSACNRRCYG